MSNEDLIASYNQRDLILYALSLGFGTKGEQKQVNDEELRFLYEGHPGFVAVPTFCLALDFWANYSHDKGTSYDIPPFPPVGMSSIGTIPFTNLCDGSDDISQYPVLHMSQSIVWHRPLVIPKATSSKICTRLEKRTIKVIPKSIGTFVTQETTIRLEDPLTTSNSDDATLLCTLQATSLVLGIPEEGVIPLKDDKSSSNITLKPPTIPTDRTPDFEWTHVVSPTQALLYRLASGDSNKIHVTGDEAMANILGLEGDAATQPILHGLCTLGIAARAILLYTQQQKGKNNDNMTFSQLQCQFSKPVFTGNVLQVKIWETATTSQSIYNNTSSSKEDNPTRTVIFVVVNKTTGGVVVDKGCARLCFMDRVPEILSRL